MTNILYAAYSDPEVAERTLGELLEAGIAPEDLSLVAPAKNRPAVAKSRALKMVDAGQSHLDELRLGLPGVEAEGYPELESQVGGGISTDDPDDDVSFIDEMDDSQEVAEDVAEPISGRWYGLDDEEEAREFAANGALDVTVPTSAGFGAKVRRRMTLHEGAPVSAEVLGGLLILGDGPLATELLSTELARPDMLPEDAMKTGLYRQGVAPAEAISLTNSLSGGGAVLAVTEAPGRLPLHQLEALVEKSGASALHLFVAAAK